MTSINTDLSKYKDVNKQKPCHIVAAGPSLYSLNLNNIHKDAVISVNSSCIVMPWLTGNKDNRFWISTDAVCIYWSYFIPNVCKSACNKIVRSSWSKHHNKLQLFNFDYFDIRKSQLDPLDDNDPGLCFTSSLLAAIDFAILMKSNPIYIHGLDHYIVDGKSHFWQFYEYNNRPYMNINPKYLPDISQQKDTFDKNINIFNALNNYAKKYEIQIYNCNLKSEVKVFDFIQFNYD